ncbi:heterokaryon incompatibility protein-domain-containing protein [Lasiosphaeria hispida]|uniref:Heterokaryon incompatibility protein-domain-containing protein n=1 Tax=Lasiosphaeria hispida TaxID=260671 RepID=A0AAJ0H7Z1_9PEZI|nr:heterokaryon incompatibility protein-domain-containing protein [Lasiosphaeria hispida]
MQNAFEYDPNAADAEAKYGSALYPKFKAATGSSNYGVQLVDDAAAVPVPLRARAISDEVDMERVASWIRRCREEHGPRCVEGYLAVADHPIRVPGFFVIDVNRKCLTTLPGGMEYVALSYVWGKSNHVNTTKSNVDLFRVDGAFDRVRLPKTIRDAIEVTARLGYRFLWVDAVCIAQDDETTKPLLIGSMDAVYGNAALTIVAASGHHAAAGFLRSRNRANSDPESNFAVQEISPGFSLGVIPFFDGELMHCPHAQRGWTYQEGCLSPRCLVFLDGLAYFVCRTNVWREDLVAESSDILPFEGANILGKTSSEWPWGRYADHVRAFASRDLTYPSDVLYAFSGIEKALARSMDGTKMWYALPAAAFDWAILWSAPPGGRLQRRQGFPSWSWTGWAGDINMAMNTWSELDQKWLRERTWVEWHVTNASGEYLPVWEARPGESGSRRA